MKSKKQGTSGIKFIARSAGTPSPDKAKGKAKAKAKDAKPGSKRDRQQR